MAHASLVSAEMGGVKDAVQVVPLPDWGVSTMLVDSGALTQRTDCGQLTRPFNLCLAALLGRW